MPSPNDPHTRSTTDGALAGFAFAAGWTLHDGVVFALSGRDGVPYDLGWAQLGLALAAAALGALVLPRRRLLLGGAAVVGLAGAATLFAGDAPGRALIWTPRLLALAWLALLATDGLRRLGVRAPLRVGLLLGVLACAFSTAMELGRYRPSIPLLVAAAAAVLAASLPRTWMRAAGVAAVVLLAFVPLQRYAVEGPGDVRHDPSGLRAPPGSPNLVFVVLDTVRADRLAPYGYERETTPRFDAWMDRSFTRYTHAWSTSSWTLPSHGSLFTGLFPAEHGATLPVTTGSGGAIVTPLRSDVPTLAEILRERGYRTGAFFANSAFLNETFGMHRGFETFDARRRGVIKRNYRTLAQRLGFREAVGRRPYRRADWITSRALEWLDEQGAQPFFLALNYMDAHRPLLPHAPHDRAFGGPVPADPLHPEPELGPLLYDRALRSMDAPLARLLEGLERRGLYDSTVVIFTSDHGAGFGEHDFDGHGLTLYDEVTRVPLYVKPAGRRERAVSDEVTTGVDVFHLALRGLGLEQPPAPAAPGWIGEVYRSPDPTYHINEKYGEQADDTVAWLEGQRKVIVRADGRVEAFDLSTDPLEARPLELSATEVEAARARARSHWERHQPGRAKVEVDDASLATLRELGYL